MISTHGSFITLFTHYIMMYKFCRGIGHEDPGALAVDSFEVLVLVHAEVVPTARAGDGPGVGRSSDDVGPANASACARTARPGRSHSVRELKEAVREARRVGQGSRTTRGCTVARVGEPCGPGEGEEGRVGRAVEVAGCGEQRELVPEGELAVHDRITEVRGRGVRVDRPPADADRRVVQVRVGE